MGVFLPQPHILPRGTHPYLGTHRRYPCITHTYRFGERGLMKRSYRPSLFAVWGGAIDEERSCRPSLFAFWGGGIDEEFMQALPVPPFGEGGLMRRSCRIHCDPRKSNVSYRKKLDEANVHVRLTAIVIQPTEKRKRRVEPPHRGGNIQKIRLSNHINSWTINSCRGLQPQPAVYTYSGGGNSFLTGCAA